ncbi:MAG: Gfo/Idh/MocA family oxidoreductase [Terrimicrobiaceae bacterium]|nr:Gfo/Idh/MocA family oxidoreductase [Terrimicrobiaceae bacterium]
MSRKIALIGLGQISEAHLKGIRLLNQHYGSTKLELSAVVDPLPNRAEEWLRTNFTKAQPLPVILDDYRLLLEPSRRPDMVSILVPHHLHLEIARPFLQAGIGVQMQKPIGLAIRDGLEIIELARNHRAPLVVSEPSVLGRRNRREIDWIASGVELGRPTLLLDQAVIDLHGGYFMTPWRHLKGMAGAGWFIDHGVHRTHWMLETLGPCETVCAETRQIEGSRANDRWGRLDVDTEDLASAILRFRSGAIAQFTVMSGGRGKNHGLVQLYGTKGSWNGKFTATGRNREEDLAFANEFSDIPEDSFAHSYQELLERIERWDAPVIGSPERALEAEAVIYACLESAHTGAVVKVEDILNGVANRYEETVWNARERLIDLPLNRLT